LAGFLYYLLAEGIAGATLGKAIAGIQVRKKAGTSCGLRASMVRNVFRIVDVFGAYLVGLFVAIFSKARQRVGDHVAGTIVGKPDRESNPRHFGRAVGRGNRGPKRHSNRAGRRSRFLLSTVFLVPSEI
jgi:uncharacterized RDD family membrane protein YckC